MSLYLQILGNLVEIELEFQNRMTTYFSLFLVECFWGAVIVPADKHCLV